MSPKIYVLKILDTEVRGGKSEPQEIVVKYQGNRGPAEISQLLVSTDVDDILAACEVVSQQIFRDEFRLNSAVDLSFTLADENGIKIWHTKPNLYIKCPLTMTMKWSCHHLNQNYKTMTTLGVVEMPPELPLNGNSLGVRETARLIMESMASGVEFMGNVMLMPRALANQSDIPEGHVSI